MLSIFFSFSFFFFISVAETDEQQGEMKQMYSFTRVTGV